MAQKNQIVPMHFLEADGGSVYGKVVNVYDTYAHALAHGATGLMTIYDINNLTGVAGSAISQVAKTTGVVVNQFGQCIFSIDDGNAECYLMSEAGKQGVPYRHIVA